MRLLILLLSTLLIHLSVSEPSETELCIESPEECRSTDYDSYVKCVRRRQKRSTDCQSCSSGSCDNTCTSCDCDSCSYTTCTSCNTCCTSCCSNFVSCRTHHCCHKTCHAQCQTSSCRSSCRRNCFGSVDEKERQVVVGGGSAGEQSSRTNLSNENKPNITTIIHLNNVINNTNIIDLPISLNNTNTQNITLYEANQGSSTGEKCCTVIGPRQCTGGQTPRCFHYRSKQCGAFCTADIVHKEHQQVCETIYPGATPNCRQQIFYIPQPQPRCVYQSVWPYVSCGVSRTETCHGCYSHYVDQTSQNYLSCPNQCYDQGYGIGPMYRQGPFYQPVYSHAPCFGCMGMPSPYGMGIYSGSIPNYPPYGGYSAYGGSPSYGGLPFYGGSPSYGGSPNYPDFPVYIPLVDNSTNEVRQDPAEDVSRLTRELEIEVKYELPSDAQAQVKIQKEEEEVVVTSEASKEAVSGDEEFSVKQA